MKRVLFYLLNLTWGLPLNIIGGLVALILLGEGENPKRFGGCACFEIGDGWGGLNLGLFIFCQRDASDSLKAHELGHAIQNSYFGPIMLLFVLCSAARYHDRNRRARRGETLPPYDSWWFEGQATEYGHKYIKLWEVES